MRLAIFIALFGVLILLGNNSQAETKDNLPIWFNKSGFTKSGENALAFVKTSEAHGIEPARYNLAKLESTKKTRDSDKLLQINKQITHSVILYLLDLRYGVQGEKTILAATDNSDLSQYKNYFSSVLKGISQTRNFDKIITSYVDEKKDYWKLQKALSYLQVVQENSLGNEVQISKTIKPEESNKAIPLVREKLAIIASFSNSDFDQDFSNSEIYDKALETKVREFQKVSGLSADGVIGRQTVARLNNYIPFAISQVSLTLDKIRSDDAQLLGKHVIINIPAFELSAFNGDEKEFSMPVVVGKKSRATPEFSNHINRVVFNPEWFPTKRIVREDLLPKVRNNSNYLARGGYKVIWKESGQQISSADQEYVDWNSVSHSDVRIIQSKGRSNALGVVKFIMPNNNSIYMHDTNHKELFARSYRALSSGCIRLSDPMKMAGFVFNGNKVGNKTFDQIISAKSKKHLKIDESIKVKAIYHTAWVDDNGKLQIRDDIYGKSKKLKLAMKKNKLEKAIASISPTYPSSDWASVEMDEFASLILPSTP